MSPTKMVSLFSLYHVLEYCFELWMQVIGLYMLQTRRDLAFLIKISNPITSMATFSKSVPLCHPMSLRIKQPTPLPGTVFLSFQINVYPSNCTSSCMMSLSMCVSDIPNISIFPLVSGLSKRSTISIIRIRPFTFVVCIGHTRLLGWLTFMFTQSEQYNLSWLYSTGLPGT